MAKERDPRFLIIGAGMSGILSAIKLQKAGLANFAADLAHGHFFDRLVDEFDDELHIRPEDTPLGNIHSQAVQTGQRIACDYPAPPANDIALIVILGGLDQDDMKLFFFLG